MRPKVIRENAHGFFDKSSKCEKSKILHKYSVVSENTLYVSGVKMSFELTVWENAHTV